MPPILKTRIKVGQVEALVSFYDNPLITSGVGESKVILPDDIDWVGIWDITVNTKDMQRFVDELGVDDRAACGLVLAHELGHVLLLYMGMTHDFQRYGGEPVAEWLASRLAWPVLVRMKKGISFLDHAHYCSDR